MKQSNKHIDHISANQIQSYLNGNLNSKEQYLIERHLLDCELCNEALEGYKSIPDLNVSENDIVLKDQLKSRVSTKQKTYRWSIAASIAVLIGFSIYLVVNMLDPKNSELIVSSNENQQDTFFKSDSISKLNSKKDSNFSIADNANKESVEYDIRSNTENTSFSEKLINNDTSIEINQKVEPVSSMLIDENLIALNDGEINEDIAMGSVDDLVVENNETEQPILIQNQIISSPKVRSKSALRSAFSSESMDQNKIGQEELLDDIQYTIFGIVKSENDGMPMAGVNVLMKNTTNVTTTDIDGNFELEKNSNSDSLVFSFIGFETKEVHIGDKDSFDIYMIVDDVSIAEIVVTAGEIEKNKKTLDYAITEAEIKNRKPQPSIGFASFNQYLKDSLRFPEVALLNKIEGKVKLRFEVDAAGSIRNIQIIKSLGYGCDEEAVRLLVEGSTWKPGYKKDKAQVMEVQINVVFKME